MIICKTRPLVRADIAAHRDRHHRLCFWVQGNVKERLRHAEFRRRRRKHDPSLAEHAIKAFVGQHKAVLFNNGVQALAFVLAFRAPDFKDIRKVRFESQAHLHGHGSNAEIGETESLIPHAVPEKPGTKHMYTASRDDDSAFVIEIGIRQIHGQQRIVFLDGRTEQHRPIVTQKKLLAA